MTCTHQTRQDIVLKEIHITVRERRWGVVRGGEVGCGEGRGVEVKREGDSREACLEEQVSAVLTS